MDKKASGKALLPFGIFVGVYLATGMILNFQGVEMAFYQLPAPVAAILGVLVAFVMFSGKMDEKLGTFLTGCGSEGIMTMCMIYLFAGAFATVSNAMGGVDSVVNLGMSVMPPQFIAAGAFVISAFIALATGTSVGTVTAMTPITIGLAEAGGINTFLVVGATIGGAMFGDNLSIISDTTIAAVRTQGCEMRDKFKQNFLIVLPAAIITIIILFIMTSGMEASTEVGHWDFIEVVPYLVVLVGALIGLNVFLVLFIGIILSMIVGITGGAFTLMESFTIIGEGMTSMFEISIISIIVACMVSLIRENGGIALIIDTIERTVKSKRGAELGIGILVLLVDLCTANNTVAIVMAGPVARDIADKFGVDRKRSASILDIFASVGQGLIPYGAQMLTVAALVGISPIEIIPNTHYPMLMLVFVLLFIFFRPQKNDTTKLDK